MGGIIAGGVDEPDRVWWRWVVGLAAVVTVIGTWLFGFGSPAWIAVPVLVALAMAGFLLVFAGVQLLDGEVVAQASAVLATVVVGLAVAWSIKRWARRQERSRWRVSG